MLDLLVFPLAGLHFNEALSESLFKVVSFGFNNTEERFFEITTTFSNEVVGNAAGGFGFEVGSFPDFEPIEVFEGFITNGIDQEFFGFFAAIEVEAALEPIEPFLEEITDWNGCGREAPGGKFIDIELDKCCFFIEAGEVLPLGFAFF